MSIMNSIQNLIDWSNLNSGFISVVIFLFTLFIGWISGLFKFLRQKPKFVIEIIPGPSIGSIVKTNQFFNGNNVYRTAISLYLKISNLGSMNGSIDEITVYFKRDCTPFNFQAIHHRFFYSSVLHETKILSDFQAEVGESEGLIVYPFLRQKSLINLYAPSKDFLRIGECHIGVTYFEEKDGFWGKYKPLVNKDGKLPVKVAIKDLLGNKHILKSEIPFDEIENIRKTFNESFGKTHEVFYKEKSKNLEG